MFGFAQSLFLLNHSTRIGRYLVTRKTDLGQQRNLATARWW